MATPQLPLFTIVNNERAREAAMKSIPIYFQGETYFLENITGSLLKRPARSGDESVPKTDAIADARLREVDDPFLLKERKAGDLPDRIPRRVRLYAALLTWLCRHSFPLARLWAAIPLRCYPDAGVATEVYYRLYPGEQQKDLCLPRAFFARSTSKRFRCHGAMFIGAFLPSAQMHAWVIEDNMHADAGDNSWTNYIPVAIF